MHRLSNPEPSSGPLSRAFEVRDTLAKGRGLYTITFIPRGAVVLRCSGGTFCTSELLPEHFAMQIGDDLWLCSDGRQPDDCANHSCDPNLGFTTGEPILCALRDIEADEELCWDYSTSLAENGWRLECLCGAPCCRGTVRSFPELSAEDQQRLRPIALTYLRLGHGATLRQGELR